MKSSEIVAIACANADSLSATKNPPPGIIDTLRMCADEIERLTQAPDQLAARLERIAAIIEHVDHRCMAADGPVTDTLDEMTQDEISRIYALAKGHDEDWTPKS